MDGNSSASPRPHPSALHGTSVDLLDASQLTMNFMPAPSAEPKPISPVPVPASSHNPTSTLLYDVCSSVRDRIVTPYNSDAFEVFLSRYKLTSKYPLLVHKLHTGFPLRDFDPISKTYTPPNHPSANLFHEDIEKYLFSECEKGRMAGPYSQEQLEEVLGGPFRSSLVQIVLKQVKRCMAINLSFKGQTGFLVNDIIDAEDFPTHWGGASEVEDIIANAPAGAQAATLDVEAAFRTIPVWPPHKAYTVVSFKNLFWLDQNCPFGCCSSGGNHGEIADATVDIWDAMDVHPVVKWVDNFTVFHFPLSLNYDQLESELPHSYAYGLMDIKRMIEPLGVPWHPDKGQDFSSSFVYLGFLWDIDSRVVSLTDTKRQRFKSWVDDFLNRYSSTRAPLHVALMLSSSLSHVAFVYPHRRSYLSNLYTWISQFTSTFRDARRYTPHSVLTDLHWWSTILDNSSWTRSLLSKPPITDLGIWVDASTDWGIGLIWDNGSSWDAWRLRNGWWGPG
ncbi:hypothetical protein Hypma_012506 [Hypsizygus marmoreus]|uniref:Reverse transcriptase domain-containing protein n=1 Tax=Hypsizygus marmoreus TaxID=39966 RepID=A0A369JLV9_HYPMA|nr:hypothetical protein Hypma_012506 [Hypsizygus marmoreus]